MPLARMAAANLSMALRCAQAGWLARTSATSLVVRMAAALPPEDRRPSSERQPRLAQRKAVKLGQPSPIKGGSFPVHRQGRRGRSDAIQARRVIGPDARP